MKKSFENLHREWNDLCKCQLKPGSLTDIPFLVRPSALLNHIMPIVSNHLWSLFNRHRKTDLTKRVNAENAVRQSNPHEDDIPSGFFVRSPPNFLLYPRGVVQETLRNECLIEKWTQTNILKQDYGIFFRYVIILIVTILFSCRLHISL